MTYIINKIETVADSGGLEKDPVRMDGEYDTHQDAMSAAISFADNAAELTMYAKGDIYIYEHEVVVFFKIKTIAFQIEEMVQ